MYKQRELAPHAWVCTCLGYHFGHLCKHIKARDPVGVRWARPPAKRLVPAPPLLLLGEYCAERDNIEGWWWSEKLDGVRAYWDGKHLWSRAGYLLDVPSGWTHGWPSHLALDGELWAGRNTFETTRWAVQQGATLQPEGWHAIRFWVFDLPASSSTLQVRWRRWLRDRARLDAPTLRSVTYHRVRSTEDVAVRQRQRKRQGAEGLVLRDPEAHYAAGRHRRIALKWKD